MADVFKDLNSMHRHYGFHERVAKMTPETLRAMLEFRLKFLQEELKEMSDAIDEADPEGVVDSLIDLVVVAVGTLDLYGVDGERAWNEVHRANMAKEPGVKASRPNPLGIPDLIKPEGWRGPNHAGNHGTLPEFLNEEQLELFNGSD